jgi:hypothetical protein
MNKVPDTRQLGTPKLLVALESALQHLVQVQQISSLH